MILAEQLQEPEYRLHHQDLGVELRLVPLAATRATATPLSLELLGYHVLESRAQGRVGPVGCHDHVVAGGYAVAHAGIGLGRVGRGGVQLLPQLLCYDNAVGFACSPCVFVGACGTTISATETNKRETIARFNGGEV